jgi:hypothetical protein
VTGNFVPAGVASRLSRLRRYVRPQHAEWLEDFRTELLQFPRGRYDDQVDSLSQFLNWIEQRSRSRWSVQPLLLQPNRGDGPRCSGELYCQLRCRVRVRIHLAPPASLYLRESLELTLESAHLGSPISMDGRGSRDVAGILPEEPKPSAARRAAAS